VSGQRRRRAGSGTGARRWVGASVLALGVAVTAVTVPPVVLSWADDPPPAAAPPATATVTAPATPVTTPATSAPPATTPPSTPPTTPPPTRTAAPTKPPFRPITIDAADPDNDRYGIAVTDCPTCESGSRVQYLGQGHALVVHVRDVPAAGRRTLTIYYTSGETRELDVRVNGGKAVTLRLDGAGSWDIPVRTRLPIQLPAGDSEIMFLNPRDPAPDLDRITLT
jgi:hypothetical protein